MLTTNAATIRDAKLTYVHRKPKPPDISRDSSPPPPRLITRWQQELTDELLLLELPQLQQIAEGEGVLPQQRAKEAAEGPPLVIQSPRSPRRRKKSESQEQLVNRIVDYMSDPSNGAIPSSFAPLVPAYIRPAPLESFPSYSPRGTIPRGFPLDPVPISLPADGPDDSKLTDSAPESKELAEGVQSKIGPYRRSFAMNRFLAHQRLSGGWEMQK